MSILYPTFLPLFDALAHTSRADKVSAAVVLADSNDILEFNSFTTKEEREFFLQGFLFGVLGTQPTNEEWESFLQQLEEI